MFLQSTLHVISKTNIKLIIKIAYEHISKIHNGFFSPAPVATRFARVSGTGHSPLTKIHMACHEPEKKFRKNFFRMVHGGGGGSRTRVPTGLIKSSYMLVLSFVFSFRAAKGSISKEASLKSFKVNPSKLKGLLLSSMLNPYTS